MITFTPIHQRIQKTLYQKIDMLTKNTDLFSIGSNITRKDSDGDLNQPYSGPNENYMMARSTWTRATSFVPVERNRPVILMGGELDSGGNLKGWFAQKYNTSFKFVDRTDRNLPPGMRPREQMPYRPLPGIKDISVEYRGGGMSLGATRTSEINWTCWTWEELDRLQQHFLAHGKTVFLEWGWTGVNNKLMLSKPYPLFKKDAEGFLIFNRGNIRSSADRKGKSLSDKISEYILKQNGHYDAMLGKIQNFTWTVRDDGGFDCVTTLVSTGMSALQKTFKSGGQDNLATLPVMVDDVSDEYLQSVGANQYGDYFVKLKVDTISRTLGESTGIKKKREANAENWKEKVRVSTLKSDVSADSDAYPGRRMIPSKYFRKVSPYINFKNYIADLPDQLYWNFLNNENTRKSGAILRVMDFTREFDGDERIVEVGGYEQGGGLTVNEDSGNSKSVFYCTWGWFEDNVLSRFFSDVAVDGRVEGIFRSLDYKYKETDGADSGELEEGYPQSVKIRSSKKLYTVDTSKWLLIKDDVLSSQIKHLVKYQEENKESVNYPWGENPSGDLVDPLAWRFSPKKDDTNAEAYKYGVCTEDEGFIRNVYFHGMYLRDKMVGADTMESAIMSVWNEFSAAYGSVHQFKIEFEDDGNHIVIRDTGQQGDTVINLIEGMKNNRRNEDTGEPGDMNGLFEFPIWENGSIVKSQNLNAKLPSRMQMAAMYGSQNVDTDERESQRTNDELAGLAWGKLFAPDDEDMSQQTLETLQRKKYKDMIGHGIDYPSKLNRSFGVANADPTINLHVGDGKGNLEAPKGGTLVYPSIFEEIFEQQAHELQNRVKQKLGGSAKDIKDTRGWFMKLFTDANTGADLKQKVEILEAAQKKFKNDKTGFMDMYEWVELGEGAFLRGRGLTVDSLKQGSYGYLKIRGEYIQSMKAYFRGDIDGLANKTDPIIPVELEMEIDGTGGIFPGNAFQSSYLPDKYKRRTCFQVKGASHTVDSSGWVTTITGQIRVGMREEEVGWELGDGGDLDVEPIQKAAVDVFDTGEIHESSGGIKLGTLSDYEIGAGMGSDVTGVAVSYIYGDDVDTQLAELAHSTDKVDLTKPGINKVHPGSLQEEVIEINGSPVKFGTGLTNSDGTSYGGIALSHSDHPGRYWDIQGNEITRNQLEIVDVSDLWNDEANPNYDILPSWDSSYSIFPGNE